MCSYAPTAKFAFSAQLKDTIVALVIDCRAPERRVIGVIMTVLKHMVRMTFEAKLLDATHYDKSVMPSEYSSSTNPIIYKTTLTHAT